MDSYNIYGVVYYGISLQTRLADNHRSIDKMHDKERNCYLNSDPRFSCQYMAIFARDYHLCNQ